ncbi:hypothetical protein GALMADRAFT_935391 [Galerina marginata CBS 339.88]|uniref:Uncharacterized protein n=1 Tax=Galerina marginata (strain CBS 339.88) TaxID=685588 RepID=A0A067SGK2_GALM3|nr:hypothetical protein GALMADRAFT_935391 [Galerina marginata CBS 339.88]
MPLYLQYSKRRLPPRLLSDIFVQVLRAVLTSGSPACFLILDSSPTFKFDPNCCYIEPRHGWIPLGLNIKQLHSVLYSCYRVYRLVMISFSVLLIFLYSQVVVKCAERVGNLDVWFFWKDALLRAHIFAFILKCRSSSTGMLERAIDLQSDTRCSAIEPCL